MEKTYEDVLHEIEELRKYAEDLRKSETGKAIDDVKAIIAKYGLTAQDIGFPIYRSGPAAKLKKQKGAPKYRSDTDPADTYGGKGPLPKWLKDKIADGRGKEEFKIGL